MEYDVSGHVSPGILDAERDFLLQNLGVRELNLEAVREVLPQRGQGERLDVPIPVLPAEIREQGAAHEKGQSTSGNDNNAARNCPEFRVGARVIAFAPLERPMSPQCHRRTA